MTSTNPPKYCSPDENSVEIPVDQSVISQTVSSVDQPPSYHLAHQYLLNRINYERQVAVAYQERHYKLQRMRSLLDRLGNPQQGQRIIHIAGTKGKGSTAAMIAEILSRSGLKTGVFSSPHLHSLEERMAIDGKPCSCDQFVQLIHRVQPVIAEMDRLALEVGDCEIGPTYFEITTALALMHFADCRVDATILEVGLGGRLDSTNVCQTELSIITSISFDHTQQLGNTLDLIAKEKAGIIKPDVPVISGVRNEAASNVIQKIATENHCQLIQIGQDFDFSYQLDNSLDEYSTKLHYFDDVHQPERFDEYELQLLGEHQAANAAVAITAVLQLKQMGWKISPEAIQAGLRGTKCPARIEVISKSPLILIDTAHNVASIRALVKVIQENFQAKTRRLIFATSRDKDISAMLGELIPHFDQVIFTKYTSNPRVVQPGELVEIAKAIQDQEYRCFDDAMLAWQYVRQQTQPNDLACITGSFLLAAELRESILLQQSQED